MSLLNSLGAATSALDAQRRGLEITGRNMANLNAPGYARRTVTIVTGEAGAGTSAQVTSTRDAALDTRYRRELQMAVTDRVVAEELRAIEGRVQSSGTSVDARLNAFFDAWSLLASQPSSTTARQGVVAEGRLLSSAFIDTQSAFTDARQGIDLRIRTGTDALNALASQLALTNDAVMTRRGDPDDLADRQAQLLEQMSELADIRVVMQADGTRDVTTSSGAVLVEGRSSSAIITEAGSDNGLAQLRLHGADITRDVTGGQLGGWLTVRDGQLPDYMTRLDALASSAEAAVNAAHEAGISATGAAGLPFFTRRAGVPSAASAMQVNPELVGNPALVAASTTGTAGDNGTARAIAGLRTAAPVGGDGATVLESWSALVFAVGTDTQSAQARRDTRDAVMAQLAHLRDQAVGVSLDDEAAALMRYQRAFEANAQYFAAINDTLMTLMALVGGR